MYANSDFYIQNDTIEIEQNSAEADRAAIAFSAGLANARVRIGLTDTRLAELRTLIGAYLADKYGDADMGASLGLGRTNEDGECPSGLQIQHDGESCADAHPLI